MQVAIAGGHGKIGRRLIGLLAARRDAIVSLDRNPDHAAELREWGAEPRTCDLEHASVHEVAGALDSVDAAVFTAGAGPGSGSERKWTMDYAGAVKLMAACELNGIRRFVIVSSRGADPDAEGDDTFAVYLRAKGRADAELERSGLDYTIVRPTRLTDDPATGRVDISERIDEGAISREDVAAVLAAVLDTDAAVGKSFGLSSGETPVDAAVASLA